MNEEKKAFVLGKDPLGDSHIIGVYEGEDAQSLIEAAQKHGTPIIKDEHLVSECEEALPVAEESKTWDIISVMVSEIQSFVGELDDLWARGTANINLPEAEEENVLREEEPEENAPDSEIDEELESELD